MRHWKKGNTRLGTHWKAEVTELKHIAHKPLRTWIFTRKRFIDAVDLRTPKRYLCVPYIELAEKARLGTIYCDVFERAMVLQLYHKIIFLSTIICYNCPMNLKKMNLSFWRILTGTWGVLTLALFILDFFSFHSNNSYIAAATSSAVIYGFILALYVGSKEFQRWQSKKGEFKSLHFGEIYPILWSLVMFIFILLSAFSRYNYKMPGEFPAIYITVLGIYMLSQQSKSFYTKK